ncbi:type VII secretion system-associated protein [Streptomyces sp. HM190]|uniref:type VII secretion system-associated protein n=1 Tax=Streptomyces sp. HM190 TaxID=2695266 RepID=UPI001F400C04|nr:type VII secretion system-associated protein [Streptomyces sp. HM190]
MTNDAAPAEEPGAVPAEQPDVTPAEAPRAAPVGQPQDARPPVLRRPVTAEDLPAEGADAPDGHAGGGPMPAPPRHVVEAAEEAPGHWFALPDPAWTGAWPPPSWTVPGEWRADDSGRLVAWRSNPDYLPSPAARGWAQPTDPVDAAVQRAAAGYGHDDEVPELLAGTEVAVFVGPDGAPVAAVAPDGTPVVLAFTSAAHLTAAGRLTYEIHDVPGLTARMAEGHQLYLNASAAVSMCVEPEALSRAIERARTNATTTDASEPDAAPELHADPDVPEPHVSEPHVSEPDAVEPDVPEPDVSEPDAQETNAPEPDVAVPVRVDTAGSAPVSLAESAAAALMSTGGR